jgi:molybdopterin synthase catalytic subunit
MPIRVAVQASPFDISAELAALSTGRTDIGAIASFTGLVRADDGLTAMTLEHHPTMTLRQMQRIAAEAEARWPVLTGTILHRHGRLLPGDPIVLVAVACPHRAAAFAAAAFLMDWLKTKAPFWKREEGPWGSRWVEAKEDDDDAAARWL